MQNTLLLMARHGQTDLNSQGNHVGWSEIPLDEIGRQQAREAGAFISKLPFTIKHVITSDLVRAQETASLICSILNIPDFYTDELLRDLKVGDLEGKDEIENPIDEYLEDLDKKFPNGESINEFNQRQYEFASQLLSDIDSGAMEAGSILVVTHAPVLSYWVQVQKGNLPDDYLSYDDIVTPGGVVLVTDETVLPIHNRNTGTKMPLSDGTKLSGFVTALENLPPRECWCCKWSSLDQAKSFVCGHPLVNIDPELNDRRTTEGTTLVEPDSCCNSYQASTKL
jgi:probable phosphoglycerate mutase